MWSELFASFPAIIGQTTVSPFPISQETGNPDIFNFIVSCPSPSLVPPFSRPTCWFPKLSYPTDSHSSLLSSLESSNSILCLVYSFHVSKLGSVSLPRGSLPWYPLPDTLSCGLRGDSLLLATVASHWAICHLPLWMLASL